MCIYKNVNMNFEKKRGRRENQVTLSLEVQPRSDGKEIKLQLDVRTRRQDLR